MKKIRLSLAVLGTLLALIAIPLLGVVLLTLA